MDLLSGSLLRGSKVGLGINRAELGCIDIAVKPMTHFGQEVTAVVVAVRRRAREAEGDSMRELRDVGRPLELIDLDLLTLRLDLDRTAEKRIDPIQLLGLILPAWTHAIQTVSDPGRVSRHLELRRPAFGQLRRQRVRGVKLGGRKLVVVVAKSEGLAA